MITPSGIALAPNPKYASPNLPLSSGIFFFSLIASKITVDGECSHEINRGLFLGRKTMTSLDNILKSRDITLPAEVYIVKAMVFPVVMYGYGSWTLNVAEC